MADYSPSEAFDSGEDDMDSPRSSNPSGADNHSPPRHSSRLISLICIVCNKNSRTRQLTRTPCGHVFCRECIEEVVMALRACPTCAAICFGHELKPLPM